MFKKFKSEKMLKKFRRIQKLNEKVKLIDDESMICPVDIPVSCEEMFKNYSLKDLNDIYKNLKRSYKDNKEEIEFKEIFVKPEVEVLELPEEKEEGMFFLMDADKFKSINDTFGHEEGDKQIKSAADFLYKTQLENSEIIRTDGNEFMVYLVGYNEKQVINYLKKLVKEFKELPYEYGAAFGFSMIVDDLKLIDDAINEATIQMRENKETTYETNESEN